MMPTDVDVEVEATGDIHDGADSGGFSAVAVTVTSDETARTGRPR